MAEPVVGVVGGVGPFAGLDLLKKIFEQTLAVRDQDHLKVIGMFRPDEIEDRTHFLLTPGQINPGLAIARQILDMERIGAVIAGIPCNTAHAPKIIDCALEELKKAGSKIKFVNMIQETALYIQKTHPALKKIGVLSSTGTYKVGIYPLYLKPLGYEVLTPHPGSPGKSGASGHLSPAIWD